MMPAMPDDVLPRFLTVKELAEVLHLHPVSIYAMLRRGQLPAIKAGRQYLFDLDKVLNALAKEVQP